MRPVARLRSREPSCHSSGHPSYLPTYLPGGRHCHCHRLPALPAPVQRPAIVSMYMPCPPARGRARTGGGHVEVLPPPPPHRLPHTGTPLYVRHRMEIRGGTGRAAYLSPAKKTPFYVEWTGNTVRVNQGVFIIIIPVSVLVVA